MNKVEADAVQPRLSFDRVKDGSLFCQHVSCGSMTIGTVVYGIGYFGSES